MLFDSLLSLGVVTICGLLLLPIYIAMQQNEQRERIHLHASQVLYSAATFIKEEGVTSGIQIIDDRRYRWSFEEEKLCVFYYVDKREVDRCVSKTKEASR